MGKEDFEKKITLLKESGLVDKCKGLAVKYGGKPTTVYGFRTNTKYQFKDKDKNLKITYFDGSNRKGEYLQVKYGGFLVLEVNEKKNDFSKIRGLYVQEYFPYEWEEVIDKLSKKE